MNIYFLGIGGIGMSALARYFLHEGRKVAGYDRVSTVLTKQLQAEGAQVHYNDDAALIPPGFRDPEHTLVVYTPAVPADHPEMVWFREHGFRLIKRSQMLGEIARGKYVMAVAGTHGKTSTTTLVAWLNDRAGGGGSAFLGGISKNFDSNLVLGRGERLAVEGDEFDRSFLTLWPDVAVITSADPDHLDIYGTPENMRAAFEQFIRQVREVLILKDGVELNVDNSAIRVYRYGLDRGDIHAANLQLREGGYYDFDIVLPDRVVEGCTLGIPGLVNVENALAAVAAVWVAGFDEEALRRALVDFRGVRRRFDFWINTPQLTYIDDYAHHPRELSAAIGSIRKMFPGRRLTAVFQPHLYSRTKDFHKEFGEALSLADEVVLTPIYPARELPIEGVKSEIIGEYIAVPWVLVGKEDVADLLARRDLDVVVTFGAGDIENQCAAIAEKIASSKAMKV